MPKGFTFRLQPVLEQRERLEKEQQKRVAEVERERLTHEERLRGLQRGIVSAKTDLRERLGGAAKNDSSHGVELSSARLQASATLHLVAEAQRTALQLAGTHRRLETQRVELARLSASKKAVEILKARKLEEWKRAEARKEQLTADDLTMARVARRMSSGSVSGDEGSIEA